MELQKKDSKFRQNKFFNRVQKFFDKECKKYDIFKIATLNNTR